MGGGIGTTAATVTSAMQVSGPLDDTGTTADTADGDAGRYWYATVYNNAFSGRYYKGFALCASDDLGGVT